LVKIEIASMRMLQAVLGLERSSLENGNEEEKMVS
jgi:hypothetical protein